MQSILDSIVPNKIINLIKMVGVTKIENDI